MLSRGTANRTAAQLAREIDAMGAQLSTFSGRNSFGIQAKGLSRDFPRLLQLIAEVIISPVFPVEELEKVRTEMLAALDAQKDRLSSRALRLFRQTLYLNHPYRLDELGSTDTINAIERGDLVAYHHNFVTTGNLVLAVVGDVAYKDVVRLSNSCFATMPSHSFVLPTIPQEPPQTRRRERKLELDREQTHLLLGFRGSTLHSPDRYALEVLEAVLGGQAGRLFSQLRDRESLAYAVDFFSHPGLDPGYLGVYMATSPSKIGDALHSMQRVLRELCRDGITEDELIRARNYVAGNYEIGLQGVLSRAFTMALNERYGLGADFHRHYPDTILGVSRDQVRRVTTRYIDLDRSTLVILGASQD
jgi:zinc protease